MISSTNFNYLILINEGIVWKWKEENKRIWKPLKISTIVDLEKAYLRNPKSTAGTIRKFFLKYFNC